MKFLLTRKAIIWMILAAVLIVGLVAEMPRWWSVTMLIFNPGQERTIYLAPPRDTRCEPWGQSHF
jgi:hypothetical protein